MSFTDRELWTLIHGIFLGAVYLLAFAGGLARLYSLKPKWVTVAGIRTDLRQLDWGTTLMAIVAWFTVITGTYVVYPWYRAPAPEGADLHGFPRNFLLADPDLAAWHTFGMEWKEHIAWFAPILATTAAYLVSTYGEQLAEDRYLRTIAIVIFTLAFVTAAVAALFGALITKAAPIL